MQTIILSIDYKTAQYRYSIGGLFYRISIDLFSGEA